jgi:photosystem II stability/assembly factor-like uncharacterized protein
MRLSRWIPPLALLALCIPWTAPVEAQGNGLEAPTVYVLAAAPSRPSTLYAGLFNGGVFRSRDEGKTWTLASPSIRGLAVYSLTVSPTAPGTVYAVTSGGVYKTTSGGETWRRLDPGAQTFSVWDLVVDPRNGKVMYALLSGGPIRRSSDGGATWTDLSPETLSTRVLRIDPQHPDILYATAQNSSVLLKSTDEGETWTRIGQGLAARPQLLRLVIDPRSPQTLYITQAGVGLGQDFVKSTDGGETWAPLQRELDQSLLMLIGIAPGRTRPVLFGAQDQRLYRSTNGGLSWSETKEGLPDMSIGSFVSIASTPGALLLSTYVGVFRSTDGGASWSPSSRGLKGLSITSLEGGHAAPPSQETGR